VKGKEKHENSALHMSGPQELRASVAENGSKSCGQNLTGRAESPKEQVKAVFASTKAPVA
jgi:hypothetical protein